MKNDKQIHRSEMPANANDASAFQPPHKPGYDVIDSRGPGAIKDVGDMTFPVYPGALDGNILGVDMSHDATNRLGAPAGRTDSDAHEGSTFQHPAKADRDVAGNARDPEPTSMKMSGCGSDDMMDRFPDRQRSNAKPDADD